VKKILGLSLPGTPWATPACRGTPLVYFTFHIYSLLSAKSVIDLYVMTFTSCGFCEHWFSEGRPLFKGVNTTVFVAVFLAQFGRNPISKMCTKLYSVIAIFLKIRTVEAIIYLGA